ncbi:MULTISPECIES: hypothetical protein [Ectothiorhodospira]|uniref:hypothetical protein n=1 Tax=Ectothiorhodospira TaxID=1051 RepID=UPI001EE8A51A|nr:MULTISPECIES: hypothetical protein [Ectothiorhodospira]MCG5494906.1 hypothetical protein [Ectothiorhodospira variabilis]MCG5497689.1 hypothetical protein [Ectothiorhodospira variabilis]MCG5504419.1 hypothetical protein [Ectothiorhodospira variabilis]MCG5507574.1 hypothetical protein [Ectothiorhodospira variabilis]MCG5526371.1 hypothetical protein [Ectothiorhodospira haloalkaliphila]
MINLSRLSLDRTPPLWVPLQFMITAPLFAVLFALLMLWLGPQTLLSRWMPGLIGATHVLVLGYLAMVMFGAMQQLLPVVAGSPLPRDLLTSRVTHGLLALGTPFLGIGLATTQPWAVQVGGVMVLGAMMIFIIGALISLARSRARGPTPTGLWLAVISLLMAMVLGGWLASGHLGQGWPLPRYMTDIHLIWAFFGWIALLIAAVAYQVVPMFQMTPEYPRLFARGYAPLVFTLLILLTLPIWLPVPGWLAPLAGATLAAALAAFAAITLWLQSRRRRRNADVTVHFWRTGLIALLAAIGLWALAHLLPGWNPRGPLSLLPAWLFLAGFAMSIINGMLYKIVPFLVWLHLNNQRLSTGNLRAPIPNMHEVIPLRLTRWQLYLHWLALAGTVGALFWSVLFTPALLLLAASNGLLTWNLAHGARQFRRWHRILTTPNPALNANRTS